MPLCRLDITDFRNITSARLEPLPHGFNVLYGQNGSGKTSLLEAIYYLSVARSFRSSMSGRLIRHSSDKFLLFAQKILQNNQIIPIGIERPTQGDAKIRIAGNDVSTTAELADLTPVQLIHSDSFHLLEGGPLYRRKFLDWGIFYHDKTFLRVWREMSHSLKQRNAALRSQRPRKEIAVWTRELAQKAVLLDGFRQDYIGLLLPLLQETVSELLPDIEFDFHYDAGWDVATSYDVLLEAQIEKDLHLGHTQYGPHRADFKVKTLRTQAKDILSRGQQKLFVCAMILAQGALLSRSTKELPIYLVDDLTAELDSVNRARLITLLSKQKCQVFVTAVEQGALGESLSLPTKMFHVEHGKIIEKE